MGVDYLDLLFRIEKEFKVKVTPADLEAMATIRDRRGLDIPARAFLDLLISRPACLSCGHSLHDHGHAGVCPQCGRPFTVDNDEIWERLRQILAAVVRRDPAEILEDSLLIRDLGFT